MYVINNKWQSSLTTKYTVTDTNHKANTLTWGLPRNEILQFYAHFNLKSHIYIKPQYIYSGASIKGLLELKKQDI